MTIKAEVLSQNEWFSWSLNQLSREFGIARETVQNRLHVAGVKPSGDRRGFPVYSVSQAAQAILCPADGGGKSNNDPDLMTPKERADWFKSENDRLKFEREAGILIDAIQARSEMAVIAKTGMQVLETLPDILERDFALDPAIISGVESKIDGIRSAWAELLEQNEDKND